MFVSSQPPFDPSTAIAIPHNNVDTLQTVILLRRSYLQGEATNQYVAMFESMISGISGAVVTAAEQPSRAVSSFGEAIGSENVRNLAHALHPRSKKTRPPAFFDVVHSAEMRQRSESSGRLQVGASELVLGVTVGPARKTRSDSGRGLRRAHSASLIPDDIAGHGWNTARQALASVEGLANKVPEHATLKLEPKLTPPLPTRSPHGESDAGEGMRTCAPLLNRESFVGPPISPMVREVIDTKATCHCICEPARASAAAM